MRLVKRGHALLVVENDPSIAMMLFHYLTRAGHQVTVAESCADGLLHLKPKVFNLVITDIRLGDGFGGQICDKASSLSIPSIVMTGEASRSEVADAVNAGASIVLEKPFDPDDLLKRIETVIKEHCPKNMIKKAFKRLDDED